MTNSLSLSGSDFNMFRQRIVEASSSKHEDDYKASVIFYSKVLPKLMGVERCTIFIMENRSKRICSMFGTGLEEINIEAPLEGSIVGKVISTGESIVANDLNSQNGYHTRIAEQTGFTCFDTLCTPIKGRGESRVYGAIQLLNKSDNGGFSDSDRQMLEEVALLLSTSIETISLNQEILQIADYLGREVGRLAQASVRGQVFIADSPAMQEVLNMVEVVSKTPVNVMLLGENGTGKELLARMIHEKGERRNNPFVPVNCACIPDTLIESEFFGHEKGAFTGAEHSRKGRFEESTSGTLFLDEIADMQLSVQPKFLRAIEEQEGRRLGGNTTISYDIRLISATNKDIMGAIQKGLFREDLYFRLFSVEIIVPPLRKRPEDILPLALHFLTQINTKFDKQVTGFSNELLRLFERYSWPGNVRQLMREVERLVALTPSDRTIQISNCSSSLLDFHAKEIEKRKADEEFDSLSIPDQVGRLEKELIGKAMERTSGNKSQAARLLCLTRQGLAQKLKRYKIAM